MTTLIIETITGKTLEIVGEVTKKEIEGQTIYYCNNQSFPAEIVKEVK